MPSVNCFPPFVYRALSLPTFLPAVRSCCRPDVGVTCCVAVRGPFLEVVHVGAGGSLLPAPHVASVSTPFPAETLTPTPSGSTTVLSKQQLNYCPCRPRGGIPASFRWAASHHPGPKGRRRHRCPAAIDVAEVLHTTPLRGQNAAPTLVPLWEQRREDTRLVAGVAGDDGWRRTLTGDHDFDERSRVGEGMLRTGISALMGKRRWRCQPRGEPWYGGIGPGIRVPLRKSVCLSIRVTFWIETHSQVGVREGCKCLFEYEWLYR